MAPPALSACAEAVRKHDNDRFLAALFAPAASREDLFALYAFNHEVAKTREVVTEPTLGQIRLQWWRESIEGAFAGNPRRHEVVEPLAAAIARHQLDRAQFDLLIDGREADLDDEAPADLDCLVSYAQVTGAPLTRLACQVLGARDQTAMEVARLVGTAWALTGILRATPFLARGHRSRLPLTLMAENGVTEPALFDLKPEPGLAKVVEGVADTAHALLAEARRLRGQVPKAALPALLPATLAGHHLGRLRKAGYDPLAPELLRPSVWRPIAVGWAATTGRW
ncbi:phytoene/squalene synthase family protein [Niveispirillum sp. KHB5.9]|uniref:phytoene/squalene synthase family protein n=1 Tax=Niveispirillum sp. KHB5.9 TaxID=3400269 RepID=UPI003A8A43BA